LIDTIEYLKQLKEESKKAYNAVSTAAYNRELGS
jgi:hypothetical protein